MSDLIVIAYGEEDQAAAALATLQRLQDAGHVHLEDAVAVTKNSQGQLTLAQSVNLTRVGAATGGISGGITGAIGGAMLGMLGPLFLVGAALGASVGAVLRNLSDYGIEDRFVRDLGAQLEPASSALFVLVRSPTPGRALPELSKYGGTVLYTTLSAQVKARIQTALQAAQTPPPRDIDERTA